jgi:hypothetical protein
MCGCAFTGFPSIIRRFQRHSILCDVRNACQGEQFPETALPVCHRTLCFPVPGPKVILFSCATRDGAQSADYERWHGNENGFTRLLLTTKKNTAHGVDLWFVEHHSILDSKPCIPWARAEMFANAKAFGSYAIAKIRAQSIIHGVRSNVTGLLPLAKRWRQWGTLAGQLRAKIGQDRPDLCPAASVL